MFCDRGPVPEAIELDARFGLEQFHRLKRVWEESFSQTQPISQELLAQAERLVKQFESHLVATAEGKVLNVAQAMVVCRRFGRACPRGVYWIQLVQRVSELAGARPMNAPTAARLAAMGKLRQRLALRDLLEWAHSQGVLMGAVTVLDSVPRHGWVFMEGDGAGLQMHELDKEH
jgi:hypothetical protein